MPTVPNVEPLSIRAGDSVSWSKSLSDYPATGWTLTYYFAGSNRLTPVATADGTDFLVTITAADTATLPSGRYVLLGRVTKDAEAYTVFNGSVDVLPNFADEEASKGVPTVTHARKCRDALRAMMEKRASIAETAYVIFGERSADLLPVSDALKLLSHYEDQVRQEEVNERASRGESSGIYIRFREAR